jgi:hypothetical protein
VALALAGAIVAVVVLAVAVLHKPAHDIGWVPTTASVPRPE